MKNKVYIYFTTYVYAAFFFFSSHHPQNVWPAFTIYFTFQISQGSGRFQIGTERCVDAVLV